MNKLPSIFIYLFIVLWAVGCKSKQNASELNILQNAEEIAIETSAKNAVSTIQKGDQLAILVTAKNMEVVKPFNQNYYSSQSAAAPNVNNQGSVERNYLVSSEGDIDFPVLGSINTEGKTLEDLKSELADRISAYVKNPTVSVRLINFRVTVLGEVTRPGQYTLSDVNPTLLNALGLAGDLTMYGKRDNILIVRNINGETTKERINLMDASFINSSFFQLKQGDVIYVPANRTKDKTSRLDPNTPIYISVAGIAVTILALIFAK